MLMGKIVYLYLEKVSLTVLAWQRGKFREGEGHRIIQSIALPGFSLTC